MNFLRLFFVLLLIAAASGCTTREDPTPAEKRLLLTAEDLLPFGLPAERLGPEKFEKTLNFFDRSIELSYVMDASAKGLYVMSSVSVEASEREVALGDKAFDVGMKIGLKSGGLEEAPITTAPVFGRKSRLSLLKKEGRPVGNLFTAIVGTKIFLVLTTGLYFDDPALFGKIITPKIQAIMDYQPRGMRRR
jgi:hypothetical protein